MKKETTESNPKDQANRDAADRAARRLRDPRVAREINWAWNLYDMHLRPIGAWRERKAMHR